MSTLARRVLFVAGAAVFVCLPGCMRGGRPDTPTVDGPAWSMVGDTWQFTVSAPDPDADNVSFRFRRDSEVDTGWTGYVPSGVELGSARAWAAPGRHHIAAQARDDRGGLSEWSDDRPVTVVPSPGYPDLVTGFVVTPHGPDELVVSLDGARLYVAQGGEGEVAVYAVATSGLMYEAVLAPWTVGDIALSADGAVLYAACGRRLFVLDALDLSVVDSVVVGARVVRASPGGGFVYTILEDTLFAVRIADLAVVDTVLLEGDDEVLGLSPDGRLGYVVVPDGLLVLGLPGCERLELVPSPLYSPCELMVSPDGRYVYLLEEGYPGGGTRGMCVLSTADWTLVLGPTLLGNEPPADVALMPSGEFLLAADASGDSIVVFRTSDFSPVESICVPVSGTALAVSPDGARAFVTSPNHRVRFLGYRSTVGAD